MCTLLVLSDPDVLWHLFGENKTIVFSGGIFEVEQKLEYCRDKEKIIKDLEITKVFEEVSNGSSKVSDMIGHQAKFVLINKDDQSKNKELTVMFKCAIYGNRAKSNDSFGALGGIKYPKLLAS